MPYSTIVCLDDLTRPDTWPTSELVFDLVRLPIFHASGMNIGRSPHRQHQMNLLPGFSLARFRQLCESDGQMPGWQALHHAVPPEAAQYLLNHLHADALVLGQAMPPWLLGLLEQADIAFIDLRPSPLRFGSDLYMGLRTNRAELHAAALALALSADEVLADSNQMAARLRLQRRSEGRLRLLNNPCVYVGQTEDDPALVNQDGSMVRAADHAEILCRLARTGPMMYLPHPRAGDFARIERESIERVIGQRLAVCEADTYDLLACDDELMLLGLNAESLQEAAWFARPSYALSPLPAQPVFGADAPGEGYLQIASHVLTGERLWAGMLGHPMRPQALNPAPRAHLLRELLNDWWGYADATLRGHGALREAFAQAGGQRQADALRRCEAELASTREQLQGMGAELERLKALVERQARLGGQQQTDENLNPRARRQASAGGSRKAAAA